MPRRLAMTLALTLAVFGVASARATAADKPNIVIIVADDLGSYDVGWRGSEIKTPNLDALAKSGARLDAHYVQPVCSPTRAALMTGRYPFRYGFQTGVVRPWADYGLPLEERLLPQALKEVGYETAIVGKWHLGHFRRDYLPTSRGFDHQYGHYNGAIDYFKHERDGGFDWHRDDKVNRDEGYSTELIGREASARIKERDAKKPLFLYVPFNGVHSPHQVPDSYLAQYDQFKNRRRTYAGMVTALDDAVGVIVKSLRDEKIFDDTLVIFTSDNGGPNPGQITRNGPLRAGKGTVYEGGVRVCAFAAWPGKIPAAAVDEPVHVADWYPTLLKLTGAPAEQKTALDGRDIWPVLTEKAASPHEDIVLNHAPNRGAIRAGDWKLVVNGGEADAEDESEPADDAKGKAKGKGKGKAKRKNRDGGDDTLELFNLKEDVAESKNLADEHPDKVKELLTRYEAYGKEAVPPKTHGKPRGFESPAVWGE